MSRIHEALQRAYRERGKLPVSEDDQVAELTITPVPEEPPLVKPELVLENIAQHPWKPITAAFPTLTDRGAVVEQFRRLRSHIYQAHAEAPLKTILIGSGMPSEGKTFVAANLAMSMARNSVNNILLIDGDLRRPSVHKFFNISSSVGLSNVLLAKAAWRDAIVKPEGIANLDILAAGPPSRSAGDLIGTGLLQLLDEVSEEYDLVILDAPPLLGFAEPLQMASFVDGVIVIARAGETGRKAVGSVLNTLARLRANVLGVVLNEVHKDMSDSYSYYGNYRGYYRGYDRREEIAVEEHAG